MWNQFLAVKETRMKPSSITTCFVALLLAATASFVACGSSTNGDPASGGASGYAGKASTNGGAGAGASSGGSSSHGGSASGGAGGAAAGAGGAAAGAGGVPSTDRCGGCVPTPQPQICIYQAGGPGPGRFVCATQNPCRAAGACACIVGQGTCNATPEGGSPPYCVCDNELE